MGWFANDKDRVLAERNCTSANTMLITYRVVCRRRSGLTSTSIRTPISVTLQGDIVYTLEHPTRLGPATV